MYSDNIERVLDNCMELAKTTTCNKTTDASILILPNGKQYSGSSGSKTDPCSAKGKDYCIRHPDEYLGFLTCPSFCGEGEAFLGAYLDDQEIKGSSLFTTRFPCQRCKDLIIHFGVEELFFINFKHGYLRSHENDYVLEMLNNGVRVCQMNGGLKELGTPRINVENQGAGTLKGQHWLRIMLDEDYRTQETNKSFGSNIGVYNFYATILKN